MTQPWRRVAMVAGQAIGVVIEEEGGTFWARLEGGEGVEVKTDWQPGDLWRK